MQPILKYPRTQHIEGSKLQPGDEDLSQIPFSALIGRHLVVEEKLDGANCGISFSEEADLILQSRGHVLSGGPRERQFDLFKAWAQAHKEELWSLLGTHYIMYGEWLFARHTLAYDQLPHYFFEFDVYDKQEETFLSTEHRKDLFKESSVCSAPVLHQGKVKSLAALIGLIGSSPFRSGEGALMEGLYIKEEEGGVVTARYKFVRHGFFMAVEYSETHWINRPIEQNKLKEGVDIFAVRQGDGS